MPVGLKYITLVMKTALHICKAQLNGCPINYQNT